MKNQQPTLDEAWNEFKKVIAKEFHIYDILDFLNKVILKIEKYAYKLNIFK